MNPTIGRLGKFWMIGLGLLCSCASAPKVPQQKLLVAVMPFSNQSSDPEYKGIETGLADSVTAELVKTNRFRLIERQRTEMLLQEAAIQQTGITDAATAVKIGKQLGAKAYVLGSIISVSAKDEWRSVKFAEKTVRETEVEAEIKLVDVETGEILGTARKTAKAGTAEKHAFGGKIGELASKAEMAKKALQKISASLTKDLVKTYSSR